MIQTLYVFDLDGVLFDNSHRMHLLPKGDGQTSEQWDAFNLACEDDAPIEHMWALLKELYMAGGAVLFLTGRSEVCRRQTHNAIARCAGEWLTAGEVPIIMRPIDDHRRAADFKLQEVTRLIERVSKARIVLVDDDETIIEACRPLAIYPILVTPFSGCAAIQKQRHGRKPQDPAVIRRPIRTVPLGGEE